MLKVLYVEDDFSSRQVMSMIERMQPDFMQLTMWADSVDFREHLDALAVQDLILLDIHMQPYNGFQMLALIRDDRRFDEVPVVALTASVMNEEVRMLNTAGFQGVFSKPLDMDMFHSFVERILAGEHVWYVC